MGFSLSAVDCIESNERSRHSVNRSAKYLMNAHRGWVGAVMKSKCIGSELEIRYEYRFSDISFISVERI